MNLKLTVASAVMVTTLSAAEEDLNTPPVVTARAWVIADGKTGDVLFDHHGDEPRKSASTTKIMCAYTVLQLAETNAGIMDERVTFSQLAGTTGGSTAEIRPGESVSVRDCLFGLLLPSGNDAGNALAEHFNARFAGPDDAMLRLGLIDPKLATRVNFVAEMNRHARQLGMSNTTYRSPFGDGGTDGDRTTTARDLTRLAWTAMQSKVFRDYVATVHHEGEVTRPDGTRRTQSWENSNALLKLNLGYDGIKTGITNQAGHCLVASGHRGSDHLMVTVLGCSSDDGRFADARNLFRWAWTKRQTK